MFSLRSRFIAFILAILVVLLLLVNTYPVYSLQNTVYEGKRSSLTTQASLISSALAGLPALDHPRISRVLRMLELEDYDRILVSDAEGVTVYDSAGDDTDPGELCFALEGEPSFHAELNGPVYHSHISVPITRQGAVVGSVALIEDDEESASIIHSMRRTLGVLSVLIAFLSVFVAFIFSWLVLRRFDELVDSMHRVAGGDYSYRQHVTGRDEISQLGREFNSLAENLERTEVQRRRFVSDASHELKTPLASIRLLSDSILQDENMAPETVREFIGDIDDEAIRLQRTTDKLLNLARMDDGAFGEPGPVDLGRITLAQLARLANLAGERQVQLESDLKTGCVVTASDDAMAHMVFNLLENAIKYNVPDGQVLIRTRKEPGKVVLTVEDTGIGIPEEDRENIFTRFYRVDRARSRQSGGSGLGLSIVHEAVTRYGGSIRVEPNEPHGSVFTVVFPSPETHPES